MRPSSHPYTAPQPGYLVFYHGKGIISRAIRLGEWLRFRDGAWWNHVAVLDFDGTVIQAGQRGVVAGCNMDSLAIGGDYEVVAVPGAIGKKVVTFAQNQVGQKYGFVSILSIAVRILTPKFLPLPTLRSNRTWICSALGAEAARFAGWYHDWPDVYSTVPSELYAAIKGVNVRQAASLYTKESEAPSGRANTQDPR